MASASIYFSSSVKSPLHRSQYSSYTTSKPLSLSFNATSSCPRHPFILVQKLDHCTFNTPVSCTSSDSYLNDSPKTGRFLSAEEVEKLRILADFNYCQKVKNGFLRVRLMGLPEIETTVWLLAESFAESMAMPLGYVKFLAFLVRQYVMERRALMPHMATLVGFYERENGIEELAGTVEISFDIMGANASPPTPTPPRDFPYICNMAVKKELRRIIDKAPLQMYKKAGYSVIKTDNILIWLTLQRRKHLMRKTLSTINSQSSDTVVSNGQPHL